MPTINAQLQELIDRGLVDASASSLPVKRGYIHLNDGTKRPWETHDATERPVCEVCGTVMQEGVDTKHNCSYWWCPDDECAGKRMQVYMAQKKSEYREGFEGNAEKIMAGFGVMSKYAHATLDNFAGNEKLVARIKAWIASPDRDLFLWGDTGSGKTHIACAILREYARRGARSMYFKSFPMLLLEIRDTYGRHEDMYGRDVEDELDILDRYIGYNLLVIDDLGAEKISEASRLTVYQILDGRINHNRRTIVTSNLALSDIESRIDKRISSRLLTFRRCHFTQDDYRARR